MAVMRPETAADDRGADAGQVLLQFGGVHHLKRDAADLAVDPGKQGGALFDFLFAEAQPEAAILLQAGIHPGHGEKLVVQIGPEPDGFACPAGITRHAAAFAR